MVQHISESRRLETLKHCNIVIVNYDWFYVYQKVEGQKQCSRKTNDGIWHRVYQKVDGQKPTSCINQLFLWF